MLNKTAKMATDYSLAAGLEVIPFQDKTLSQSDWWTPLLQMHWGELFAAGEQVVSSCKINRVYYKSEKQSYRVYLKARIESRNGRFLGEQALFAHLLPEYDLQYQWVQAKAKSWTQPTFGPAVCLIPQPGMIIWAYPNDPKVPGIALLADSSKILAKLQENPVAFGLKPSQQPIAIKTATLTKYVTSQRCGYLYEVELADGTHQALYGKAYREASGAQAQAIWQQIWNSPARQQGDLLLPEPYSYDVERHILWQEVVKGRPLAKILPKVDLPQIASNVGHQLAALHNLQLDLPTGNTLEQERGELAKCLTAVSRFLPQIANRCQKLYEHLLSDPETLQQTGLVPIHASFKPSHILVENGRSADNHSTNYRCTLIDFDGTVIGDAGYDLGRFIAHLRGAEAKGKLDSATVEKAIINFCTAYNQAANQPVAQVRINWFTTSLLLSSHIYKLIKRLSKKRLDDKQIDRLLTLAEQTLSTGTLNNDLLDKEATHVI